MNEGVQIGKEKDRMERMRNEIEMNVQVEMRKEGEEKILDK